MTQNPDTPTIDRAQAAAKQLTTHLQRARVAIVEAHRTVSMRPYLNLWGKMAAILFIGYLAVLEYLYIRFPQAMGVEQGTLIADTTMLETLPAVFYGTLAVTGIAAAGTYCVTYLVATTETER